LRILRLLIAGALASNKTLSPRIMRVETSSHDPASGDGTSTATVTAGAGAAAVVGVGVGLGVGGVAQATATSVATNPASECGRIDASSEGTSATSRARISDLPVGYFADAAAASDCAFDATGNEVSEHRHFPDLNRQSKRMDILLSISLPTVRRIGRAEH
jgi:hypothetical protein